MDTTRVRGACRRRQPPGSFAGVRHAPLALVLFLLPASARAQQWNSPDARALADRAIVRRVGAAADTTLHDYRAQAHGFLFFLGAFGEGLTEPPRLIKADQLELEVYWKAPGASKQRIVGWRDRAELPTDIVYHQDHLGIVQNGFGKSIRLGGGDEVQDVPHPLAVGGPQLYDYAIQDTLTLTLPDRQVRVVQLAFRPKEFRASRIVGTAYLDLSTGDLVRLAFNFTPAAYRDASLEDVSVVLDNALYAGRWWLPRHQEIEIRRHAMMLDLPARGIIRGRWDVDGYQFNTGLTAGLFTGPEITVAPKAVRDSFSWRQNLDSAEAAVAEPVRKNDLAALRSEVARVAGRHALSSWRRNGLAVRSLSDLLHVNRVQGVVPGAGWIWRGDEGTLEGRVRASYGFADRHVDGAVSVRLALGGRQVSAEAYREVRDVADRPVVSPVVNSIASQEFGDDYGDYARVSGGRVTLDGSLGGRATWRLGLARETPASLIVRAAPMSGEYRPNPALGGPTVNLVTVALTRAGAGLAVRRDHAFDLSLEAGGIEGGGQYARVAGAGQLLLPLGGTRLLVRGEGGAASAALPAYRTFVLGGRGTLLGDDFREWGGRRVALLHVEWRIPVPFPSISLGAAARTPGSITVAPFIATGWADAPVANTPWGATPGTRLTSGVGLEWLGVFRLEVGYGTQSRHTHVALDVTRDFWSVL